MSDSASIAAEHARATAGNLWTSRFGPELVFGAPMVGLAIRHAPPADAGLAGSDDGIV